MRLGTVSILETDENPEPVTQSVFNHDSQKPMVDDVFFRLRYPEASNCPDQAYMTIPSEFPKVTDFERICEIIWPQNLTFGIFQAIWS